MWLNRLLGLKPTGAREYFADLPRLETPRLILRKARRSDAADIYAYASDPEVSRYVLWDTHRSIADSRAYIRYLRRQYYSGEPSSYVMALKDTGRVIGTVGFVRYTEENDCAEVGYSMGRDWWHQGLMTEALQAVLRLAFEEMGLHRVEARHETGNPASGRVMARCGLRQEGILRGSVWNKGRYADVALWSILQEDYAALTPQPSFRP
ncbi:MAG: GNAT family N-acetyltransferase [Clostridia bacterium]|nr:GNAT family N-acetyltransferase [Clostridia bacterium]